jgi:hypothetical protein
MELRDMDAISRSLKESEVAPATEAQGNLIASVS